MIALKITVFPEDGKPTRPQLKPTENPFYKMRMANAPLSFTLDFENNPFNPERQLQVEETEGESFMQYMLLPENNYDNSIYRQGFIYNFGGYDMSNDGVPRRYSKPK